MKVVDIFEDAIDLHEVFNTRVDISWKNENAAALYGYFKIGTSDYRIIIEAGTFQNVNFLNIAFEIFVDEKWSTEFQGNRIDASKVIGAVINGTRAKIDEYEADAILFFAVDNIDKRMKLYNRLARTFLNIENFVSIRENYKLPNGKMCTIILRNNSKGNIEDLIKYAESFK